MSSLAKEYKKKRIRTIHGMTGTRFHIIWKNMKHRCNYEKMPDYKYYGGKGITYCERWENFLNFKEDMYESYLEHVEKYGEKDTTLDRIDFNSDYCKENCRWATTAEQSLNKSTTVFAVIDNKKVRIKDYCESRNIDYRTIEWRLRHGWEVIKAITTPIRQKIKKVV